MHDTGGIVRENVGCRTCAVHRGWHALGAVLWMLGVVTPMSAQAAAYHVFPARALMPARQPAQEPVTLNVRDSTVASVVRALTKQAHLRLFYQADDAAMARRISVNVVRMDIMDALALALRGTGLSARLASDNETVLIRPVSGRGQAAGGVITGRVTDSTTGAGLKGAQVRVDGLPKTTAITGDSGNFTLREVPAGDQLLQVRLFGYRPANRTVTVVDGERTTVRIALAPVPTVLSGVVTTAAGVQRKVEVGNDITTINVDSVMQVAPISSVTNLLETRVPGLTVQHTTGVPGSPSRIRIRGVSSITGNNDPIVVIDGIRSYANQSDQRNDNLAASVYSTNPRYGAVPGPAARVRGSDVKPPVGYGAPSPLDQIDPNSIETIEVFKGPSASALYGSDAANGVIVITTKRGRAGPTHWSLNLGQGVNWLPGNWPTHYFKFGNTLPNNPLRGSATGLCDAFLPYCNVDSLVAFQALNDPRFSPFTHGSDQTAALTVSGGVPTLQYSLTGNATGDVGNLKLPAWQQQRYERAYGSVPGWMKRPDNYKTYGVSGQLTARPAAQASVTLSSNLFISDQQQGSLQQAIPQAEAEYISVIADTLARQNRNEHDLLGTDLFANVTERATTHTQTATNSLTLAWQPWSWLPLNATGGLQTVQRVDETYVPYGISALMIGAPDTTGSYGLGRGTSEDRTLTVGTEIPSRWLTTRVGVNYHSNSTNDFSAYTSQLAPGVSKPTVFLDQRFQPGSSLSTQAGSTYGWYIQPTLNFHSRFFVSPGFRLDGGSASGTHGGFQGTGLTGLPKIDFSWIAVDQNRPRGPLTLLRPRVAFGVAGTQPGPADKLRLLNQGGGKPVVLNDTTTVPGVVISTLGNTALRPETSRELEGGFDAELWRDRLKFTWTQYNKTRYNAIISIPVAPSVWTGGTTSQSVNVGVVRNTGKEVTVNAAVLESRALGWYIGANLSNDDNRVVRLARGFTPDKQLGIVPGAPLFSAWAQPIASYADLDHNGIIDPTEYIVRDTNVYVGQAEPKYQANLNTTLTLLNGRLSATATFAYQDGMTQNNLTALSNAGAALLANAPGTSLGTLTAFAAAYCATTGGEVFLAGQYCVGTPIGLYQTVNTFRFNELSVNYTLPTALTRWLRVPHASLALQGQNLALHTNYRGMDPNVNIFSTASGGDQTADLGQIPQPRIWWLKLNLGN